MRKQVLEYFTPMKKKGLAGLKLVKLGWCALFNSSKGLNYEPGFPSNNLIEQA